MSIELRVGPRPLNANASLRSLYDTKYEVSTLTRLAFWSLCFLGASVAGDTARGIRHVALHGGTTCWCAPTHPRFVRADVVHAMWANM